MQAHRLAAQCPVPTCPGAVVGQRGRHKGRRHTRSLTGTSNRCEPLFFALHPHGRPVPIPGSCSYIPVTAASAFRASRFGISESPLSIPPLVSFHSGLLHNGLVQALLATCLDYCNSQPTSLHQPVQQHNHPCQGRLVRAWQIFINRHVL